MKDYAEHAQRMKIAQATIQFTQHNQQRLANADSKTLCGCACCGHTFHPHAIKKFEDGSAICPICGMKSIIPGDVGIHIEADALQKYSRILHENLVDSGDVVALFPATVINWIDMKLERIKKVASAA